MLIRIDPRSAEPIFEQIVFAVKAALARGTAAAGQKLPSVRELARDLAINPNTVVMAVSNTGRKRVFPARTTQSTSSSCGSRPCASNPCCSFFWLRSRSV